VVRRALSALEAEGLPAKGWVAPYCTNGAVSAGEHGIPTLIYGAGTIADAHGVDESVSVDELSRAWRGYRALGRALASR
jgi:acetylornithine deacetylase/succinyl-diaminopimelate desuccinylase-like protein